MNDSKPDPSKRTAMAAGKFFLRNNRLHLRRDRSLLLLALLACFCLEFAVIGLHVLMGISYYELMSDPAAIARAPAWFGFTSQTGLLFWSAAASFCALAFFALRSHGIRGGLPNFLLATAALSASLLADDAYLLHEQVLPHFGIPQIFILSGYLVVGSVYFWCFRGYLLGSNLILLFAAAGGLLASLLSDATHLYLWDRHLFDESFKLFGTIFWAAYCFSISRAALSGKAARESSKWTTN